MTLKRIYPVPIISAVFENDNPTLPWRIFDPHSARSVAPRMITYLRNRLDGAVVVCDAVFYQRFNGFWANTKVIIHNPNFDLLDAHAGTAVKGVEQYQDFAKCMQAGYETADRYDMKGFAVVGGHNVVTFAMQYAFDMEVFSFETLPPDGRAIPFSDFVASEWLANSEAVIEDSYNFPYKHSSVGRINPPLSMADLINN